MIIAGIVAGGTGSRMGNGDLPKQFMELGGKPVFIYTAEKFIKQSDFIIIGMNKEWLKMAEFLIEKFLPESKNIFVTEGGSDRNGTVKNIIAFAREKLKCKDDDIILTHDAARPFVDERMISESISAIEKCDICTVAVPATDTIAVSADGEFACFWCRLPKLSEQAILMKYMILFRRKKKRLQQMYAGFSGQREKK